MEDNRTRQTLDALADLFLTGTEDRSARAAAVTAPPPQDDQLAGPAPIRLAPKTAATRTPAFETAPAAALDAAGPRRLVFPPHAGAPATDAPPPADAAGPAADRSHTPEAVVEAVILGNVPGLSGPWLTQYAQLLAQRDGAVAVLHIDGDRLDIERVEPAHGPDAATSRRMAPDRRDRDPVAVLDAAARAADRPVRNVLVHVDPLADELDLQRALELDIWTIVCGADEAAAAGAIHLVRSLIERSDDVRLKQIGLMVMGSDREAAVAAADRVGLALHEDLELPLELIGYQQQMVPVSLRQMGAFDGAIQHWPRLVRWFHQQEVEASRPAPASGQGQSDPEAPAPHIQQAQPAQPKRQPPVSPTRQQALPEPEPTRTSAVSQRPQEAQRLDPAAGAPQQAASAPAAVPVTPPPAPKAPAEEPDLARLLIDAQRLPGSVPLEARSPLEPTTQLALDQAGRLHLLKRLVGAAPNEPGQASTDLTPVRAAITELFETRQWACQHLELLRLTQRQLRFDADAPPALHLFVEDARLATRLTARLGDTAQLHLHIHLLHKTPAAWFTTDLL